MGWVWHTAQSSKLSALTLQKSAAEAAAAKAVPATIAALKGKPADWIPKWVEFWRVYGATNAATPLVANYLGQRAQQRAAGIRLFNESQALFRSGNRDDAFKVLEKLREEAPCTYQGYFACKWVSEIK